VIREHLAGGWRRATLALLLVVPGTLAIIGVLTLSAFAPTGEWYDTWRAVDPDALTRVKAAVMMTTQTLRDVLATEAYRERALVSGALGLGAALLAVTFGLPVSALASRRSFRGMVVLRTVLLLPLIAPPIALALGLRRLIEPGGVVGLEAGAAAGATLITVHAVQGVALATWLCGGAWAHVNAQSVEAARVLGARPWRAWRTAAWPVLRPPTIAVAMVTFGATFVSVVVVLVAGDSRLNTLETEVARGAGQPVATLAALALLNVAVLTLAAWFAWPRPRGRVQPSRPLVGALLVMSALAALLVATVVLAAVAGLVTGAMPAEAPGATPVDAFVLLMDPVADGGSRGPWLRSLGYAAAVAVLTVILGASAGRFVRSADRGLRRFARLGLLLPAVLGPAGIALALSEGLQLRQGPWLVLAAHVLIAYPLVVRIVASVPLEGREAMEAAQVLGGSRWDAWRTLRLRRVIPAGVAAAGVAAVVSLGEAAATPWLVTHGGETAPVQMLERVISGEVAGASVYASGTLMVLTAVIALVIPGRWWAEAVSGRRR